MTEGERFVGALPAKTEFHDRSKRRSYDRTRRVAVRLLDEPALVDAGRAHMARFMARDPHQSRHHALWTELLRRDVRQIVRAMLEDSPRGELLRDTQPVFVVLGPDEAAIPMVGPAP